MRAKKLLLLGALAVIWTLWSAPSRADDSWGALVVCCPAGNVGNPCTGGGAADGYGSGATQDAALASASDDAMSGVNTSYNWKCASARTFTKSCAYIAIGCNEQTNACGWALGASEDEAKRNLNTQGYTSADTDGGCVGQ